jgi:hypothetical protein
MKYRELKNYKYELVEDFHYLHKLFPKTIENDSNEKNPLIELNKKRLFIFKGYAWDGPSGITVDTKNFMRGSLVHDALYQLMRQKRLGIEYREIADDLLYEICVMDGMSKFRASYVLAAVKMFGRSSAEPTEKKEDQDLILVAP